MYFASPPVKDTTRNAVLVQQNTIAASVAGEYHGVSFSGAIRTTLSKKKKYTDYKRCLRVEQTQPGCVGGTIAIRTLTAPIQAGNHLCPEGLPNVYPWFCAGYSSGEFRFAKSLVAKIVHPPPPITP